MIIVIVIPTLIDSSQEFNQFWWAVRASRLEPLLCHREIPRLGGCADDGGVGHHLGTVPPFIVAPHKPGTGCHSNYSNVAINVAMTAYPREKLSSDHLVED